MSHQFRTDDRKPGCDPARCSRSAIASSSTAGSSGSRPTSRRSRRTISELITATEIAERAVAGLKATAHECDQTLGERLRAAERFSAGMERQLKAGEILLTELMRTGIAPVPATVVTQPAAPPAASVPDAKAVVAAAQAFADRARERARERVNGLAA